MYKNFIARYFRGVPIFVIFVGTRASQNLESRIFTTRDPRSEHGTTPRNLEP